ncbi:hypothetical protein SELMODRAFT_409245 [Selaginella moellendorffii]|uniref:Uncharacterized protein n=1 Tax=Selaginella moellendorffii TaxID=88036 RepID=D8RAU5_SELML|nr:hypothetical protein SELMODRAFT_409245 [Selaginella moellendorffii]
MDGHRADLETAKDALRKLGKVIEAMGGGGSAWTSSMAATFTKSPLLIDTDTARDWPHPIRRGDAARGHSSDSGLAYSGHSPKPTQATQATTSFYDNRLANIHHPPNPSRSLQHHGLSHTACVKIRMKRKQASRETWEHQHPDLPGFLEPGTGSLVYTKDHVVIRVSKQYRDEHLHSLLTAGVDHRIMSREPPFSLRP